MNETGPPEEKKLLFSLSPPFILYRKILSPIGGSVNQRDKCSTCSYDASMIFYTFVCASKRGGTNVN